ncbi:TPA: IS481 family transposase, partial [Klebsiella pneumoniae]|nr:IS481 family transposase [Klebsiella pneumoniae]HDT4445818.1 IS481 family transposase [Klebsiella pneumoniae]HDT5508337.1 IS481 family transposase [Klebsiella pneumoniae subsp. pneumoniae]HDU5689478.1 IS481 family transposase [Klebsiella pneumoniae]HDU5768390.1 IS481 family transposase [Klebsiella pneumoniae subsp. pneumoniae]
EQFIEFNELLLFEDLNLFNQRMAEYLVLYNSKRPHKSLELMTPVDYILRESKNCNMWWTHTSRSVTIGAKQRCHALVQRMRLTASLYTSERSLFPTEITKTTTFSSITWYTRR